MGAPRILWTTTRGRSRRRSLRPAPQIVSVLRHRTTASRAGRRRARRAAQRCRSRTTNSRLRPSDYYPRWPFDYNAISTPRFKMISVTRKIGWLTACAAMSAVLAIGGTRAFAIAHYSAAQKPPQDNKRPRLNLRAQPTVGLSPVRIVLTAELLGG